MHPTVREWLRSEQRLGVPCVAQPDALTQTREPIARIPAPRDALARATGVPASPPAPPRPSGTLELGERGPSSASANVRDHADLPPIGDPPQTAEQARVALQQLDEQFVKSCQRCGLHSGRTQTVFGIGNVRPALVFVGEGPGAEEDLQGLPFVGKAGQLLTRMIAAMTLTREQVFICNIVKCRPPGNRTPTDDEMATCAPFLFRQLALLQPRVIVALGRPASQTLLATKQPISQLRGTFHDFPPPALAGWRLPTCQLMPTFHPAYLLRSPGEKGKAWDDLKQVMALLGLRPAAGGG